MGFRSSVIRESFLSIKPRLNDVWEHMLAFMRKEDESLFMAIEAYLTPLFLRKLEGELEDLALEPEGDELYRRIEKYGQNIASLHLHPKTFELIHRAFLLALARVSPKTWDINLQAQWMTLSRKALTHLKKGAGLTLAAPENLWLQKRLSKETFTINSDKSVVSKLTETFGGTLSAPSGEGAKMEARRLTKDDIFEPFQKEQRTLKVHPSQRGPTLPPPKDSKAPGLAIDDLSSIRAHAEERARELVRKTWQEAFEKALQEELIRLSR